MSKHRGTNWIKQYQLEPPVVAGGATTLGDMLSDSDKLALKKQAEVNRCYKQKSGRKRVKPRAKK